MWTQNFSIRYIKKYQLSLKTLGVYIYIYIHPWKPKTWMLGFYPKDMLLFQRKKNVEVHNMGINICQ